MTETINLTGNIILRKTGKASLHINVMEIYEEIVNEINRIADGDDSEVDRIKNLYPEIQLKQDRIIKPNNEPATFSDYLEALTSPGSPPLKEAYLSCAYGGACEAWRSLVEKKPYDAIGYLLVANKYLDLGMGALASPLDSRSNARAIASKPRPKKVPTNKNITIAVMRKWREKGHTFDEFMGAALNESIEGLYITELQDGGLSFELIWDDAKVEVKKMGTLEDWWTDSKPNAIAKK